jgi:hypothetical protein
VDSEESGMRKRNEDEEIFFISSSEDVGEWGTSKIRCYKQRVSILGDVGNPPISSGCRATDMLGGGGSIPSLLLYGRHLWMCVTSGNWFLGGFHT